MSELRIKSVVVLVAGFVLRVQVTTKKAASPNRRA